MTKLQWIKDEDWNDYAAEVQDGVYEIVSIPCSVYEGKIVGYAITFRAADGTQRQLESRTFRHPYGLGERYLRDAKRVVAEDYASQVTV